LKKDWKYIFYVAAIIGLFAFVQLTRAKQYDWTVTYGHKDENPFGTSALNILLSNSKTINNSYKTLYELKDSLSNAQSIFIIGTTLNIEKEDTKVLLRHVNEGGTALLAFDYFSGSLSDTLGVSVYDNLFKDKGLFSRDDTATLHFVTPQYDSTKSFPYKRDNIHNYFGRVDSVKANVIAKNEIGQPVMVRIQKGKGNLFLSCTPMVFTNIHLLSKENNEFASGMLSYLSTNQLLRTQYYHLGRMESQTPLRYILTNEPLRWAYYISILSLLLFIVFEAKRRQRIIPIVKPLSNTTLEFVSTIGNLYYQKGDHKNIAEKKINYFLDQLRKQYYLNTSHRNLEFIELLALKSGHPKNKVNSLIQTINTILESVQISPQDLEVLNKRIEQFWKKK
jgi:hypothetical protein